MGQKITYPQLVYTNQEFSITAGQVSCRNCAWEARFPDGMLLAKKISPYVHPKQVQEWVLLTHTPGTYTFELYLKKRCCGNPIIQKEVFTITVI